MRVLLILNFFALTVVVALPLVNPQQVIVEPTHVTVDLGKEVEKIVIEEVVPKPIPMPIVSGMATWFDARKVGAWYTRKTDSSMLNNQQKGPYPFYAAAGPSLRKIHAFDFNDKPYRVIVTSKTTHRSIVAWVVDWCQCNKGTKDEAVIDLSPAAFRALGMKLDYGIADVTLSVLE